MATDLPFPWNVFARFQETTDSSLETPRTRGADEALTALLEGWAANGLPTDREALEQHFAALSANRALKYRRRARLAWVYAKLQPRDQGRGPTPLEWKQLAEAALSLLRAEDRRLLMEVAQGMAYAVLAAERRISTSALKTRISRLRKQIRESIMWREISGVKRRAA